MESNIKIYAKSLRATYLLSKKQILMLIMILAACGFLCFPENSSAQQKLDDIVPPPLNIITKDEKNQLAAETKMKNRTKLALELMDLRLMKSAKFLENNEYRNSLDELGGFQALVRNTLNYLKEFEGRSASLKNFKRFEMTLRTFLPKLELIRREMPLEYSYHVRQMMKFVHDTRSRAIEPMFGNTVISDKGNN
ncbi:MAG: hypothetical protein ACR2MD_14245 [Aridibacter sp.]